MIYGLVVYCFFFLTVKNRDIVLIVEIPFLQVVNSILLPASPLYTFMSHSQEQSMAHAY